MLRVNARKTFSWLILVASQPFFLKKIVELSKVF